MMSDGWRTRRLLVPLLAVIVAAGSITAGCGDDDDDDGGEAADSGMPTVKIHALEGGLSSAALRIIEQNGFDTENGFEGEFFEVSGDASVQFLVQGESDVSFDGDPITAALLQSQGEDVTTFYPLSVQDASIVVPGDSEYQTAEDLLGQRVGHDGLESGTMTAATVMLDQFDGIEITEDYDLQLVPEAALLRLVDRGDIEAAFVAEPAVSQAITEYGMRVIWGPGWEEWQEHESGSVWNITMMARQSWIEENPELAEDVTAAWDSAYEWIEEDPLRLTEGEFPELFGIEREDVLEEFATVLEESVYFTNEWTDEDVAAAEAFIEFAAEDGTVIQEAPPGSVTKLGGE